MRFSLLGPLVVTASSGGRAALSGPRLRILLAALLLHANVPVSADELAEAVWDGSPPPGSVSTLRSYVRRLRRVLGDDAPRIATHGSAYVINIDPSELDVLEFEALCRDTRAALAACKWSDAAATATRALRLWRAAPLLDAPSEALRSEFVPRLERLRLQLIEDRFEAGLRLGQHQELISQLVNMTSRYPLQERFHAQLMLALAGTGQRAEALRAYRDAREVLVAELGIEPGPELRDIHRQILAGDAVQMTKRADGPAPAPVPGTTVTAAESAFNDVATAKAPVREAAEPAEPSPAGPSQLPADIADFTGREAQVARLCDALTQPDPAAGPGAVPLAIVVGAAGLGKTALAVHTAHQIRRHFPDGQLYINLSAASTEPMTAGDALARFLRAVGVDEAGIPAGEQERAALYRTRLTDRRMLILLDDAKDTAQVRSLLPGTAACAVLVTTRNRALSLAGAGSVDLDTLAPSEALALFSRIVADPRPFAEPEATAQVLAACAGLPLAIRICGARLATRRQWRIATMATRLGDQRRRLDELRADDLAVRASFQISYDSLTSGRPAMDLQHAFRLLGLWPGAWISLPAAAALLDVPDDETAEALETLVDVNLLGSPAPDRYQFHDLLRLFATERAQEQEPEERRRAAVERVLCWYIEVASAASDCISPTRYRLPTGPPNTISPLIRSEQDALSWFDDERANITAAVRHAVTAGLPELAWRLPTSAHPLYRRRCSWTELASVQRIAVQAARTAGSRGGEAWALQCLGSTLAVAGQPEALARLEEALAIRRETGDTLGQAQTAVSISDAYRQLQGPEAAYDHSVRLLDLVREVNDPALLAHSLNGLGVVCHELGRREEAAAYYREALRTALPSNTNISAYFLGNIGRIHLDSGRLDEAIAALTESHASHTASGDLLGQALALQFLGKSHRASGDYDEARDALLRALELYQSLKSEAGADAIRTELAELAQPDAPEDTGSS